ncbi:HIT-like domain-containing protein [Delphinella strobiligena]|nr:HIT-like domain-containing protein [Delphinella strobiligena]
MPPSSIPKIIRFGPHIVTPQVFHTTPYSFCLVNLKPLLPGHVLVSPLRRVSQITELSTPEVTDLFLTVQKVSKTLKRVYAAQALNIAIQDGPAAGQSVPHVHAHIIPRRYHDLDSQGGGDALYGLLEGEEGDVGVHLFEAETYNRFPKQEDESRKARSMEEMIEEAEMLAREMRRDEEGGGASSSL